MSECGTRVATARWHGGGVWCYNAQTGAEVWSLIRGFSRVNALSSFGENGVACPLEDGRLHVVSFDDGTILRTYPNTSLVLGSPKLELIFRCKSAERPRGAGLGRLGIEGVERAVELPASTLRVAAFGEGELTLGTMDGEVWCISTDPGLTERWRFSLGADRLVELAHCPAHRCFYGLVSDGNTVLRIDAATGSFESVAELPFSQSRCFCSGGEMLFSSDGRAVRTKDWRIVSAFDYGDAAEQL